MTPKSRRNPVGAYVDLNPGEYGFVHQVLTDLRQEFVSGRMENYDVLEALRVLENARARSVGMPASWVRRQEVSHG